MTKNFLRDYTLFISGPKYKEYSGSNSSQISREITDPIHIKFNITKTILRDANMAEITLYNLNPNTEREIILEGTQVILMAGYKDNKGIIFKGQIFQPLRGKENGTDYYLKLVCLDGDAYLNLAFVSGTIEANSTRKQLAEQIVRAGTIELDSVDTSQLPEYNFVDGSIPSSERAKVVFGDPSKYLQDISRMGNSTFYIDNNQGKFFNPIAENSQISQAHDINIDTGMIGRPQQIDYGVEIRCLLNPSIFLGDFVKIDNKTVITQQYNYQDIPYLLDEDGIYRVIKINYDGDSRGQNWYCNLMAITQGGVIPSMLIGQYGNLMV